MLKISDLNKTIIFYVQTNSKDCYGGFDAKWHILFQTWGAVQSIAPGYTAKGIGKVRPWKYKLIVRYDRRLSSELVVVYHGRIYAIDQMVEHPDRKEFIVIYLIDRGKYEDNSGI